MDTNKTQPSSAKNKLRRVIVSKYNGQLHELGLASETMFALPMIIKHSIAFWSAVSLDQA